MSLNNASRHKTAINMKTPNSSVPVRNTRYSVHYKFDGDFTPIDKWLSQNCSGKFDYTIDEKPCAPGQIKNVILQFETEEDRAKFKDMILDGGKSWA